MRRLSVILGVAALALGSAGSSSAAAEASVTEQAVTFTVRNVNGSGLGCPGDGKTYELAGTLVGPAEVLESAEIGRLNILVHDFTVTGWVWHSGIGGFDYAAGLADAGEVSLVLDRLGYGGSPLADGKTTCLGAQADMLHQVVAQARAGRGIPAARRVIVHGHSVGAAIAEFEASKWKDTDGLVEMSWSSLGVSVRAVVEAVKQNLTCNLGEPGHVGRSPTFAYYGATVADFRSMHFATAPAAVRDAAAQHRSADPCGDANSLALIVIQNGLINTRAITVPVLVMFGGKDVLNRSDALSIQSRAFGSGAKVTSWKSAPSGGLLPLEAEAPAVRTRVLSWLRALPD